jgi:hypothetical protein
MYVSHRFSSFLLSFLTVSKKIVFFDVFCAFGHLQHQLVQGSMLYIIEDISLGPLGPLALWWLFIFLRVI